MNIFNENLRVETNVHYQIPMLYMYMYMCTFPLKPDSVCFHASMFDLPAVQTFAIECRSQMTAACPQKTRPQNVTSCNMMTIPFANNAWVLAMLPYLWALPQSSVRCCALVKWLDITHSQLVLVQLWKNKEREGTCAYMCTVTCT